MHMMFPGVGAQAEHCSGEDLQEPLLGQSLDPHPHFQVLLWFGYQFAV